MRHYPVGPLVLRFKLSYRDLAQIMDELGVSVVPCTILRWVIRYSVEFPITGGSSRNR
jgi:transposase-like protein